MLPAELFTPDIARYIPLSWFSASFLSLPFSCPALFSSPSPWILVIGLYLAVIFFLFSSRRRRSNMVTSRHTLISHSNEFSSGWVHRRACAFQNSRLSRYTAFPAGYLSAALIFSSRILAHRSLQSFTDTYSCFSRRAIVLFHIFHAVISAFERYGLLCIRRDTALAFSLTFDCR